MARSRPSAWWLAAATLAGGAALAWRVGIWERVRGVRHPPDVVFRGTCDASSGVPLTTRLVLVASDEDNILRAYDARAGGDPLWESDFSSELRLPIRTGKSQPETDIEAATRLGDYAYFLTSHGRDHSGRRKPERFRLFATTTGERKTDVRMVGTPYASLLDDLLSEPKLQPFALEDAAREAAGHETAFNIEGMTARMEGGVWIGFRSPVPDGNALAVPLLNPERVVHGARAEFGTPALLSLGGLGIRGLSTWKDRYLVIGGPASEAGPTHLFLWDGRQSVKRVDGINLSELNPEGLLASPTTGEALVLSDDGQERVEGTSCKKLEESGKQRFRGRWLKLGL